MSVGGRLPRAFFDRDAALVAPELLGKLLVVGGSRGPVAARIVEVEAYRGGDDPGSHAYRGPTPRNRSMFGPPGRLYTYFIYGMHWCANVVCGPGAAPHAVLLRAAVPVEGLATMRARRPGARRERDLLRGPGNLARAFGFDAASDGRSIVRGSVRIVDDAHPVGAVVVTTRVGLSRGRGDDLELRFAVGGDPHVSLPRRSGRTPRAPQEQANPESLRVG